MNKMLPLLLLSFGLLTACGTKPVNNTRIQSPEAQDHRRATYDDFVARRTLELQQMGGRFKDEGAASEKALEEAKARFGDVPADWSTTWAWGKDAGKVEKQAELNGQLDKLAHPKATE